MYILAPLCVNLGPLEQGRLKWLMKFCATGGSWVVPTNCNRCATSHVLDHPAKCLVAWETEAPQALCSNGEDRYREQEKKNGEGDL